MSVFTITSNYRAMMPRHVGFHVLFYLYFRCKGVSMINIVKTLANEAADDVVSRQFMHYL